MKRLCQSPTEDSFVQNPYPFYARARKAGEVVRWEDYGLPCATSYRTVNAILRDRRFGREPPTDKRSEPPTHLAPFFAIEANSMLELEGPRHTRLRGLVLRAFTSRRIRKLGPEIARLCHRLIDEFDASETDLLPAYCRKIPIITICRLLGVPESMADQLLAWSGAMVAMYQARRTRIEEDAAARASCEFSEFIRAHLAERRSRPADDLITHLIASERDGGKLSADELVSTCILLLNAGHEATVHAMGNGVKLLLESQTGPESLASDRIEATIEEILRFDPPLHLFRRWVYEDTEISGFRFGAGDEIGLLLASANRDEANWDAPEVFDPSRPMKPNAAFGAGAHFCIGAPLARLELGIALPILFERCPTLHLSRPPHYANLYHFHGLGELRAHV